MFNLFNRPKIKRHSEIHKEHVKAKRAQGVRKYYAEHGRSRKVPVTTFGKFSYYIYLPIK